MCVCKCKYESECVYVSVSMRIKFHVCTIVEERKIRILVWRAI